MANEYGLFKGESLRKCSGGKTPIIEHFLYTNDTLCITAEAGIGKSILSLQLICNLTTGTDFFDTYEITRPYNVLYVQTEGDRDETIDRLHQMNKHYACDDERWEHLYLDGLALNTDKGFKDFMEKLGQSKMKYDVIIFDPLYTTIRGSLSNDDVVNSWTFNVRKIRGTYRCSIITMHHEPKPTFMQDGQVLDKGTKNIIGSFGWSAFFNTTFKLTVNRGQYLLKNGKARAGSSKIIDEIRFRMIEPSPLYFAADTNHSTESVRRLLSEAGDKVLGNKIHDLTGISRASAYSALKRLLSDGLIEKFTEENLVYYRWITKEVA